MGLGPRQDGSRSRVHRTGLPHPQSRLKASWRRFGWDPALAPRPADPSREPGLAPWSTCTKCSEPDRWKRRYSLSPCYPRDYHGGWSTKGLLAGLCRGSTMPQRADELSFQRSFIVTGPRRPHSLPAVGFSLCGGLMSHSSTVTLLHARPQGTSPRPPLRRDRGEVPSGPAATLVTGNVSP